LAGAAGALALIDAPTGFIAVTAFLSVGVAAVERAFGPSESRARKARLEADFRHLAWQARFLREGLEPESAPMRRLAELRERLRELERQRYD
jgi:hypothetical protein